MPPSRQTQAHTVLAAYPRVLVQLAGHWKVSPRDLLAPSGLTEEDLSDPLARLPLETMLGLIERARRLTGEPGLGWYMGLQSRISMYGFIGFGMVSAATLRESTEMLVRFAPVLGTVVTLRLEADKDRGKASIVIEENADLGASRDFVLIGLLVAIWQLGLWLSGTTPTSTAEITIPEPEYFPRVARLGPPIPFLERDASESAASLGPPFRFGQPSNRLVFDRAKLDLPLLMADRAANKLAREQCEQALESFAGGLVERVRRAIALGPGVPSLTDVAGALHLSARTLKRQLAEQGLTFSALSVDARRDKALLLLRSSTLPVAEIADRLGYSSPATFIRAFHSWTSLSPADYRLQATSGTRAASDGASDRDA